MTHFTRFTLMYLAAGVCLTVIALQQPHSIPIPRKHLLTSAGLLYIIAILSIFRFWHQAFLNSQRRLREQPDWKQNLSAITPWLIIAVTLFSFIFFVLTKDWASAVWQAISGLAPILVCIEWIFARRQIQP